MEKDSKLEQLYREHVGSKEAAKILGISLKALYARKSRGQIKGVKKFGERSLRFNVHELLSSFE